MQSTLTRLGVLAPLALAVACADGVDAGPDAGLDAGPGQDPGADAGSVRGIDAGGSDVGFVDSGVPPPPTLALSWTPCPELVGAARDGVRCGRAVSDLDPSAPEHGTFELFVKHVPATEPAGRRIFLLAGGPGFAGDSMEPLADHLARADPGLDIYLPDHRGTGRSSRLGCPSAEAFFSPGGGVIVPEEWPLCAQEAQAEWGAGLEDFDSFGAARDLAALIEATEDGGYAFVMGVSYGTFWASRYLQMYPHQAAGVVFDSVCAPGSCFLNEQDEWENGVAARFFTEVCGADPTCTSKLGLDPWQAVQDLAARMRGGHCPLFGATPEANAATLRGVLAQVLMQADLRSALPALVYRISRCSEADQAALQSFFSGGGGGGVDYSFPLAVNVASKEMWSDDAPSAEALEAALGRMSVARGVSAQTAPQIAAWPRHALREHVYALPNSPTPALMLAAALDPATPVALATPLARALDGPHQRLVVVEHASHNVWLQSRLLAEPESRCGLQLVQAFLRDPKGELDTACASATLPPNFAGTLEYSRALFGTDDLYQ